MSVEPLHRPRVARTLRQRLVDVLTRAGLGGQLLPEPWVRQRMQDAGRMTGDDLPPLVLQVNGEETLRRALSHARAIGAKVHPVSSAWNGDHGAADLILDLSPMRRILDFDPHLGIVRVQPGVTREQLDAFLREQGAGFMVPMTGAGPDGSLVGHALERGHGMAPIADHFHAVLGLAAITGVGRIYRSALQPEERIGPYRWGIGPYLDGIFSQSGGAVVFEMTLQLAPRPECVENFVFWVEVESDLPGVTEATRHLFTRSGLTIGGITLMSAGRIQAVAGEEGSRGCAWVGTGVVHGVRPVVRAGRSVVRAALRGKVKALSFVSGPSLARPGWMARRGTLPGPLTAFMPKKIRGHVASLAAAHRILAGPPNDVALRLPHGEAPQPMPEQHSNPAQEACGQLWYAAIVPMRGEEAERYVAFVRRICAGHGIDAPITFSTLSPSAFGSTVPLLVPQDEGNRARALACLRQLIAEGRAGGFEPCRLHARLMEEATASAPGHWWLVRALRDAMDPEGLISPGRDLRADED